MVSHPGYGNSHRKPGSFETSLMVIHIQKLDGIKLGKIVPFCKPFILHPQDLEKVTLYVPKSTDRVG